MHTASMNKVQNIPSVAMPHAQRGVSKFGLLMLFLLIAGFLTFGLKVGPLYIDNNVVVTLCQELLDTGEADSMSIREIRDRVNNSLMINNIRDFDLSAITVTRESNESIISIEYERRVELVANLDVVAKFSHRLQ